MIDKTINTQAKYLENDLHNNTYPAILYIAAQTQLLQTDTNEYVTAITSEDFTGRPYKMSIQIPSEVLQLQFADSLMDSDDSTVRVVSFLYYDVDNLFPSGTPGDNG